MAKRVNIPAADDLFRPTTATEQPTKSVPSKSSNSSGRVKHDEKITVYITAAELIRLETARLQLRGQGLPADRGRIVREAINLVLADFEAKGEKSILAKRLQQS